MAKNAHTHTHTHTQVNSNAMALRSDESDRSFIPICRRLNPRISGQVTTISRQRSCDFGERSSPELSGHRKRY